MSEEEEEDLDVRPEDDVEMSFFEHLGELRARLTRACLGWWRSPPRARAEVAFVLLGGTVAVR